MSDAEGARSPEQLNKFEKLTGRPLHGETLAGQLTTLARHANDRFLLDFDRFCQLNKRCVAEEICSTYNVMTMPRI